MDQLCPRLREAEATREACALSRQPAVLLASSDPSLEPAAARLVGALRELGLRPRVTIQEQGAPPVPGALRLGIGGAVAHPQGYGLTVTADGVTVEGADAAGLFYGVCTLEQWLRLHSDGEGGPPVLGGLSARDWPDFQERGVLLDVSRNKVPRMDTLHALVDLLAGWKVNQVQLYLEHAFAYQGHEVVWHDASPLTAEEVRDLDRFCRERFIELIPNQNSFGHLHRWLTHEPYRQLAECPQGVDHPFTRRREPFSLCPLDPGSLTLLEDLYDQLLPNFTSTRFNVGCDETFDLGLCRSAEACARLGKEQVYLDFVRQIHGLVTQRGRRMQLWGDIILTRPDLVSELPRDAMLLDWGYEADHPFAEHCARFAESGLSFYVCPGTSSWLSLAGRTTNAVLNLASASLHGHAAGASGMLVTDWGDMGHLQPLPVSYLGLLAGAGFGWSIAAASTPLAHPFATLLDRYAFRDRADILGGVAVEAGDAHLLTGTRPRNGTALFHLLFSAHQTLEEPRYRGLTPEGLMAARDRLDELLARLPSARPEAVDGRLVVDEFTWVIDVLQASCDLGLARLKAGPTIPVGSLPAAVRHGLSRRVAELADRFKEIWLARNQPGGLDLSLALFEQVRDLLEATP